MISDNTKEMSQIKVVSNFEELITFKFKDQNNALCFERNLKGNFREIVSKLQLYEDVTEVTISDLKDLKLSSEGVLARNIIISDLEQLTVHGAQPSLNLIKCYQRDIDFDFISTDVYSYHVDRSAVLIDTFLCTYYGAASDIIANTEVQQKILIPEIREKLKELYDGKEEGFDKFLIENFFDLHYQALPNSVPINLGIGNLWRLAVDHPDQQVLPCVHRAPIENTGELRLMLIC